MNATTFTKSWMILALLACLLSACTGEQPRLIGSYPAQAEPKPLAQLPRSAPQPDILFVYEAWITLEVSRVTSTAERAEALAFRRGGYLESANSWLRDGRTYMILVLAVPVTGFDALREDVLDLGTLRIEQVSGQWQHSGGSMPGYAHITLTLIPRASLRLEWPQWGWNPGQTFRQAWGVFASIFGFLVDILIWLLVVAGPFVLIALGLRALWRRAH